MSSLYPFLRNRNKVADHGGGVCPLGCVHGRGNRNALALVLGHCNLTCLNSEFVRVLFAIDACNGEIAAWSARTAGPKRRIPVEGLSR
jgi:hypothetical protein